MVDRIRIRLKLKTKQLDIVLLLVSGFNFANLNLRRGHYRHGAMAFLLRRSCSYNGWTNTALVRRLCHHIVLGQNEAGGEYGVESKGDGSSCR